MMTLDILNVTQINDYSIAKIITDLKILLKVFDETTNQQFNNLKKEYLDKYSKTLHRYLTDIQTSIVEQEMSKYYDPTKIPSSYQQMINLLNESKKKKRKVNEIKTLSQANLQIIKDKEQLFLDQVSQAKVSVSQQEQQLKIQFEDLEKEEKYIEFLDNYKIQSDYLKYSEALTKLDEERTQLTLVLNRNKENKSKINSEILLIKEKLSEEDTQIQNWIQETQNLVQELQETQKNLTQTQENYQSQLLGINQKLTNLQSEKTIKKDEPQQIVMLYDEKSITSIEKNFLNYYYSLNNKDKSTFNLFPYSSFQFLGYSLKYCLENIKEQIIKIQSNYKSYSANTLINLVVESKECDIKEYNLKLEYLVTEIQKLRRTNQKLQVRIFDKSIGSNLIFYNLYKRLDQISIPVSYNNILWQASSNQGFSSNKQDYDIKKERDYELIRLKEKGKEIEKEMQISQGEFEINKCLIISKIDEIKCNLQKTNNSKVSRIANLSKLELDLTQLDKFLIQQETQIYQIEQVIQENIEKQKNFVQQFKKFEQEYALSHYLKNILQIQLKLESQKQQQIILQKFQDALRKQIENFENILKVMEKFEDGLTAEIYSLFSLIFTLKGENNLLLLSFAIQQDQNQDLDDNLKVNLQNIYGFDDKICDLIEQFITLEIIKSQDKIDIQFKVKEQHEVKEDKLLNIISQIEQKINPNHFDHIKKVQIYNTKELFTNSLQDYIKRLK